MKSYRRGSHTLHDLKVHLVWIPKYRKKVLTGEVALRTRTLLRQIAMENECMIHSGKVAKDHVHIFLGYPPQLSISELVQYLKGGSSRILLQEFAHLRKAYWGRHLWGRGYFAVSSGNITDSMIEQYIAEQEGEPVHDDGQFLIDDNPKGNLPPSRR